MKLLQALRDSAKSLETLKSPLQRVGLRLWSYTQFNISEIRNLIRSSVPLRKLKTEDYPCICMQTLCRKHSCKGLCKSHWQGASQSLLHRGFVKYSKKGPYEASKQRFLQEAPEGFMKPL